MYATSLLDFQIYQENMRSKMDFNAKKSILKMDFMDFLLCCFIGKSEKGLQTSFQKSGLFLLIIRHVSARLLFYRTVCQSPSCPYFPKTVKKENPRTDFSQLKPIIRISHFTFNSGHQNINLACPIKSTLSHNFPCVVIIGSYL